MISLIIVSVLSVYIVRREYLHVKELKKELKKWD
jgi:hypothetical protein